MPVKTSGAISLVNIHLEAGGAAYGTSSLNDADIRALYEAPGKSINNTSGTAIDMGDFYGAARYLDEQSFQVYYLQGGDYTPTTIGTPIDSNVSSTTTHTAINDGTAWFTATTLGGAQRNWNSMSSLYGVTVAISLFGQTSNSGWTYVNFTTGSYSVTLARTDMTFTAATSSTTTGSWSYQFASSSYPFGTGSGTGFTGNTCYVKFT